MLYAKADVACVAAQVHGPDGPSRMEAPSGLARSTRTGQASICTSSSETNYVRKIGLQLGGVVGVDFHEALIDAAGKEGLAPLSFIELLLAKELRGRGYHIQQSVSETNARTVAEMAKRREALAVGSAESAAPGTGAPSSPVPAGKDGGRQPSALPGPAKSKDAA